MTNKVWNLMYVVGNPAMFTRVTACADNPMQRTEALSSGHKLAGNGWRVWVEHQTRPERIFESKAETDHMAAVEAKRAVDVAIASVSDRP